MPFLIGLVVLGLGYYWYQSAHKYPEVPPTADALTLLNFPAYVLRPNKTTYRFFLGPEGLTAAQIMQTTGAKAATIARKHIALPGPTTVPTYADLWAVESVYTGPARVVTPQALLVETGVPEAAAQVEPARQLAGLLYMAAFDPTVNKLLLVPVAGKQT